MKTLDDLFAEYMKSGPMVEAARKAGVAALLQSTRPHGLLYRHPLANANEAITVPAAMISREQAGRLARLAAHGAARVRLRLANKTGGAFEARNVVAEIRGRERPDEIVLLGVKPRRTIRFVLFTGEEQGMWGSAGYVQRHAAVMDKHNAVVVFDMGTGRTSGFFLNGREELRRPLDEALAGVVGLEAGEHLIDGIDGTDNFDFLLSGVPNLVANQDAAPYLPPYHAESDTVDRVNARELRANTAADAGGSQEAVERDQVGRADEGLRAVAGFRGGAARGESKT